MPGPSRFRLSRVRVAVGWAAGVLVLAIARPRPETLLAGVALGGLGEAIRLWASGHIAKTETLATGGPYAHTRNPLYFGSLLLAIGLAVAASSPLVAGLVVVYFAAFYPAVIREEADFLRQKFGADYAAWEREVPAFFPRLTPGGPRSSRFSWAQVAKNKEWRTAIALPLFVLALWLRSRL